MLERALWLSGFVAASYWAVSVKSSEAVTALLVTAATLVAVFLAARAAPPAPIGTTVEGRSARVGSRRPRWLIPEKYVGVAFAIGGVATTIMFVPFAWAAWAAWQWYVAVGHGLAGSVATIASIAVAMDLAFLFWLAATLIYELADPD